MALDVELVLLQPRDVELLASSAALELTCDVLFVVSNNPTQNSQSVHLHHDDLSCPYFVMIPVVLTPSVRWVTRNIPFSLTGL